MMKQLLLRSRTISLSAALLVTLLGASQAQTVKSLKIDAAAQKATMLVGANMGFPDGERWARIIIDCATKAVEVKGVVYDLQSALLYTLDTLKPDPAATAALVKAKVIAYRPGALTIRMHNGTLRLSCDGTLLKSDLSAFSKLGDRFSTGGSSNLSMSNWENIGRSNLTVPVLNDAMNLTLIGATFPTSFEIANLSLGNYARGVNEAFFFHDRVTNTLVPLRYGGNSTGEERFHAKIGGDGVLTFYYAPDYRQKTGWTKVTVDLRKGLTWNEPAQQPANSKFGR